MSDHSSRRTRRREGVRWLLAAALGVAALAGLGRPAAAQPRAEHRLRLGTIAPEDTPWADQLVSVKERIERESDGRIKVILYLGGRKGDETRLTTLLRQGRIQGAAVSNGAVAAVVPGFQVLELPYLFRTVEEVDHVIDEVIGPDLEALALQDDLVVNIWAENGWRSIASRGRPVHRLEDLRQLTVRSQESPVNEAFWQSYGVEHVPIPLDQVLVALQTDVIDGFDQTPIYMAAAGWHTQVKSFTLTRHVYQPAMLVFNQRFLEGLPKDLRAIVLGERRAETLRGRAAVRATNAELLEEFRQSKIEVIEVEEEELKRFRAQAAKVSDGLREAIGSELIDKVMAGLEAFRSGQKTER